MSRILPLLVAFACLAACKPAPAPTDAANSVSVKAPADSATPAATPAKMGEFGETLLWLDPLATCADNQIGKVHWSKQAIAKGVARIETGDVNPGDFARIGDEGEKETGSWASPGLAMVLRGNDGAVLARQVFKGPEPCPATSG